jgi:hypothetical protein
MGKRLGYAIAREEPTGLVEALGSYRRTIEESS